MTICAVCSAIDKPCTCGGDNIATVPEFASEMCMSCSDFGSDNCEQCEYFDHLNFMYHAAESDAADHLIRSHYDY